ncbi:hypothetical protein HRbin18_02224 [bacterium HR18]|nr:hypothetical protein HRbin18_02224 [bacterium HR18]
MHLCLNGHIAAQRNNAGFREKHLKTTLQIRLALFTQQKNGFNFANAVLVLQQQNTAADGFGGVVHAQRTQTLHMVKRLILQK